MYVYVPALEAGASTAFMVRLQTFYAQDLSQLQILTQKIMCGYDSVT